MRAVRERQLIHDGRLREPDRLDTEHGQRQYHRPEHKDHVAMLTHPHVPSARGTTIEGMDALVAIDVAILPPRLISDHAFRLSAALPPAESQGLLLNYTNRPHITLTQQFVAAAEISAVRAVVTAVLTGRTPLSLRISGPGRGASSVWMQIERATVLMDLHGALMDALRPLEQSEATAAAFSGGDPRPGDLKWVADFRRRSGYSRYTPHITLGHASQPPNVEPIAFTAETVALCHLGRFCTCRDVLESWTLDAR